MALVAIALLVAAPATAQVRVIDGDTIDLDGIRIRLWGVDAPEGKQSCIRESVAWLCGQEAAMALREFVRGKDITCETKAIDRYKRRVAVCRADNAEVNDWMVRRGWALDYRQYSKGAYAHAESEAHAAQRGLWAGTFTPPWEWRRRR